MNGICVFNGDGLAALLTPLQLNRLRCGAHNDFFLEGQLGHWPERSAELHEQTRSAVKVPRPHLQLNVLDPVTQLLIQLLRPFLDFPRCVVARDGSSICHCFGEAEF
jgi:hypothetical protein